MLPQTHLQSDAGNPSVEFLFPVLTNKLTVKEEWTARSSCRRWAVNQGPRSTSLCCSFIHVRVSPLPPKPLDLLGSLVLAHTWSFSLIRTSQSRDVPNYQIEKDHHCSLDLGEVPGGGFWNTSRITETPDGMKTASFLL